MVGSDPVQRLHSIVVGCRESMFWCKTVFNGCNYRYDIVCHVETEFMENGGGSTLEYEPTTMEENY
ncbi:hypothetical protein Lal_00029337 [Lupinus albus]|nr:hypothetical protein Lal_00029337 [Lupinus albus]